MRFALAAAVALTLLAAQSASAQSELKETPYPEAARHHATAFRTDTIKVTLGAAKDARRRDKTEYAVKMKPGDTLVYSLIMPKGSDVYHEFHGHDDAQVTFYKKETGEAHHGSLTAPFEGNHGWYFENRTAKPVVAVLKISGFYELADEE